MIILLFFAFISGLVTIFAPCIWPLLPIVLSSTTSGGHRKPLGITLGIITSFAVFTLTISYIVKIIPFDPDILRYVAVAVIGFLGLSLIIPALSARLEAVVSRLAGSTAVVNGQNSSGFKSGFITGFSLGVVWSPCAGPILATIATLAATRAVNIQIVLVTVAYSIGVGIPLFLFATVGQRFFSTSRGINKYTGRIQQVFGVVMIATAMLILTGQDRILQVKLLNAFPSYSSFITNLESNDVVKKQLDSLKGKESTQDIEMNKNIQLADPNKLPYVRKAPEFVGIEKWLGSDPLTIESLKGKVVLVDFWTYTCINCIRTLPYVTGWYEKYKDAGFIVVGVHTPEFEFEKKTSNVEKAMEQYSIHYPVAQDNDYATWNNYDNHYWPAKYLIDAQGNIRYYHFGEGDYEETEKAIQILLKEAGSIVSGSVSEQMPNERVRYGDLSQETYLGSQRMLYHVPDATLPTGTKTFSLSKTIPLNKFSLGGTWTIRGEDSVSGKNASLEYRFKANKVFLVMRPDTFGSKDVTVLLDGKPVGGEYAGADVAQGVVTVDTDRLYELINIHGSIGEHTLRLEFQNEGTAIYAFTFG